MRYFLELCLKSVEAALNDLDAEIIVVDNNSSDDSCEMIKALFPKVKLIANTTNFGFSKGNNIGVAEAQGEYICILNPDTVVSETTFKDILKFIKSKSEIGILGCRLIDGQGQFLPESKRYVPTPSVAIKKIFGFTDSYYVKRLEQIASGRVPVLVGAFMVMKKQVYNEVGGFDEDYFMYGEDVDLSYKIKSANYHNMYYGKVTVIHYKGESTLKDKVYAKRFYGAMQIFYNKHFKSNFFFNTFVWFGIQLASLFKRSNNRKRRTKIIQYVLISTKMNEALNASLKQDIKLQHNVEVYEDDTEYILDHHHLSFKAIIDIISGTPKNCTATFKILPKNSNFIIGSDSSKSRGEVISF